MTAHKIFSSAVEWAETTIDQPQIHENGFLCLELPEDDDLSLAEASTELNTVEVGWSGSKYLNGRLYRGNRGNQEYDRPIISRGLGTDLGVLEPLSKDSVWNRAVQSIEQTVINAIWKVELPANCPDPLKPLVELQKETLQKSYDRMDGGFIKFLREATQSILNAGFAVFQIVDNPDGTLRKLAFRRANTVSRWLFDEDEIDLLAVEFTDAQSSYYTVPAEHLLIISTGLGNDLEGVAPLRVAAPWIHAKRLITQLQFAAVEKYALPIVVLDAGDDASDNTQAVNVWDKFTAQDYPVFTGLNATLLHPSSNLPDFESMQRYCDEQILHPLSADGALLGQNRHGSFALADSKDEAHLKAALGIAKLITDALNGLDNQVYTGVSKRVIDNTWGKLERPSLYPRMAYSFGEEEIPLSDILSAVEAGLIEITPEIQDYVRERLKLPTSAKSHGGNL